MQEIAFQVGFNETAFPVKSELADLRIRFFTHGHEMNLCGHATKATVFALKYKGLLQNITALTIETNAGILPIKLNTIGEGELFHACHFSSPYSGTIEDAVTGIATGVMGAFYTQYIDNHFDESLNLIVEQGHEIQKDGQVMVQVFKNLDTYEVEITGVAVYVNVLE